MAYKDGNKAKAGFFDAIVLVLETGSAGTASIAVLLNVIPPGEDVEGDTEGLAGDPADREEEADPDWKTTGGRMSVDTSTI